jgi:hypothetical protein
MLKLIKILNESKEPVKVNRFIEKSLYYMCQEEVNPTYINTVYIFLKNELYLKDEKEIAKIAKLYHYNFSLEDINENGCVEKEEGFTVPEENYDDDKHLALAEYLSIDPFFISLNFSPQFDGYLPKYESKISSDDYLIGNHRESFAAAKQRIHDIIEDKGYEYWDEYWMREYIETDHDTALYNAEERAIEEQFNNEEDDMRIDLDVDDEYNGLREDRDSEVKELIEKRTEIKNIKFKLEKLYKEKKIIEREIETLGFSLDYEDDDEYFDSYGIDISEMTDNLNELGGIIYEYLSYTDDTEKEINELEKSISDIDEEILKLEGESLSDKWIEFKTEMYLQDYTDDPLDYIDWGGFTIEEAELEGLIHVDEESLISDAMGEGMGEYLARHDGATNEIYFNGTKYYIFRN